MKGPCQVPSSSLIPQLHVLCLPATALPFHSHASLGWRLPVAPVPLAAQWNPVACNCHCEPTRFLQSVLLSSSPLPLFLALWLTLPAEFKIGLTGRFQPKCSTGFGFLISTTSMTWQSCHLENVESKGYIFFHNTYNNVLCASVVEPKVLFIFVDFFENVYKPFRFVDIHFLYTLCICTCCLYTLLFCLCVCSGGGAGD